MTRLQRPRVHLHAKALLIAGTWTGCALLAAMLTQHTAGLAMIWPANAILTAALLIEPRRRHAPYLSAVFAAACLFNLVVGRPPSIAAALAANGVGEAALAAWLIGRASLTERLFETPGNIFRFAIAAVLACLPSSLISGLLLMADGGPYWWQIAMNWLPAHGCGFLIILPMILIMRRSLAMLRTNPLSIRQCGRGAMMFGLVAAVTVLVFSQSAYALTFLILPALLIATFHLRAPGAAGSVMIIALISSSFMVLGDGPFVLMKVSNAERTYVMELFIVTMFMCALPLAAVLDQRDRLALDATQHLTNLRNVAERIGEVLFRVDEKGRWAYLSPSYETITGRTVAKSIGRSVFAELPRADHRRVLRLVRMLRDGDVADLNFSTTIIDHCGVVRHVEIAMFHALIDMGQRVAVGGIIRDVTARKLLDAQLRDRAHSALLAAERSEMAARTDELTGLPNRRAFFEQIEHRLQRNEPVTLALLDIDHFKRINDTHGHLAGDAVLQNIAAIARTQLGERDLIARIGGEEFAILLGHHAFSDAMATAQRIIRAVSATPTALSGELTGSANDISVEATVSMGITPAHPGQNVARLLAEADRALYAAKDGGRNRIALAA